MKKINSQKKGKNLEDLLERLLNALISEFPEFTLLELRPQTSGYQFGKDIFCRWQGIVDGITHEFKWSFESKHRGDLKKSYNIPPKELHAKLNQIFWSSRQFEIDSWCIFSPLGNVDNPFFDLVQAANSGSYYPFSITLWTEKQQIKDLLRCFPKLYQEIYSAIPAITPEKRNATLEAWKKRIIDQTKMGLKLRQQFKQVSSTRITISTDSVDEITKSVSKEFKREMKNKIIKLSKTSSPPISASSNQTSLEIDKVRIKEKIDDAKVFLDRGDFTEAVFRFSAVLPEVENKPGLEDELARVYNNIGVAYNAQGKIDDSIMFFRKAVSQKPDFLIAQTNIANAYISKSRDMDADQAKKELEKAEAILKPLWGDISKTKEARVVHAYLRLMELQHGLGKVIEFVKSNEKDEMGSIFRSNSSLSFYIASCFLSQYQLHEALDYSQTALDLEEDVETLTLRGRVLLASALKDDVLPQSESYEDIAPQFGKRDNLESALADFDKAVKIAIDQKNKLFFADAAQLAELTRTWLNRKDELQIPKERELEVPQNKFTEAVRTFRNRDFEISFDHLHNMPEFSQLPPSEIRRLARAYLYNGAVEIARKLLIQIEQAADENKIFTYWIDRTLVEVLLQDKNQAILSANKAIELADTPDKKKVAYSHAGAVLLRYADEDGGDRSLDVALKFDQEFPDLGVLTRIDFEKEKEKLIKMFQDRREWVEDIQKKFKEHPIPSYYLEEVFKKPFISVWSGRDPLLPIEYTITSEEFHNELKRNYSLGKTFVFDYISLLTISKLNLLNDLEKFFPAMCISFSLFQKIQEELLKQENSDLRRLWEFIRRSKIIEVVKDIPKIDLQGGKVSDIFEEWVTDTLKLAKQSDSVLVTDDLRFYRFSKSEKVTPINTWYVVQQSLENGLMDRTMYSKAIGSLAACFYTFIGFSGDDLYQIIADDNFKLSARNYHLINQIMLPGSNPRSFTQVFVHFIAKLWRSGSLPEDKVYWLSYLTNVFTDIAMQIIDSAQSKELVGEIASDFGVMWNVAMTSGKKDELRLLKKDLDRILENQMYSKIKDKIADKIKDQLKK